MWQHGPVEFERRWEAFQSVVQQIWEAAGVDSAKIMMRLALCYKKQADKRQRVLRCWETTHMRKHDKRRIPTRMTRDFRVNKSAEELASVNLKAVAWLPLCHP